jgi:Uma2 family endonuclease
MAAITINLESIAHFTRERFYALCLANPDLQLERTAEGELIVMSPVGGESGNSEAELMTDLANWNRQTKLGKVFSSSTIFSLPSGADRSPDAAWVKLERWEALTPQQRIGFPPICPDFVIELRSATDRLPPLQAKMQEYLDNGLQLGWLIDPQNQQVEIFRPETVEIVSMPVSLAGEDVLPGFTFDTSLLGGGGH